MSRNEQTSKRPNSAFSSRIALMFGITLLLVAPSHAGPGAQLFQRLTRYFDDVPPPRTYDPSAAARARAAVPGLTQAQIARIHNNQVKLIFGTPYLRVAEIPSKHNRLSRIRFNRRSLPYKESEVAAMLVLMPSKKRELLQQLDLDWYRLNSLMTTLSQNSSNLIYRGLDLPDLKRVQLRAVRKLSGVGTDVDARKLLAKAEDHITQSMLKSANMRNYLNRNADAIDKSFMLDAAKPSQQFVRQIPIGPETRKYLESKGLTEAQFLRLCDAMDRGLRRNPKARLALLGRAGERAEKALLKSLSTQLAEIRNTGNNAVTRTMFSQRPPTRSDSDLIPAESGSGDETFNETEGAGMAM